MIPWPTCFFSRCLYFHRSSNSAIQGHRLRQCEGWPRCCQIKKYFLASCFWADIAKAKYFMRIRRVNLASVVSPENISKPYPVAKCSNRFVRVRNHEQIQICTLLHFANRSHRSDQSKSNFFTRIHGSLHNLGSPSYWVWPLISFQPCRLWGTVGGSPGVMIDSDRDSLDRSLQGCRPHGACDSARPLWPIQRSKSVGLWPADLIIWIW